MILSYQILYNLCTPIRVNHCNWTSAELFLARSTKVSLKLYCVFLCVIFFVMSFEIITTYNTLVECSVTRSFNQQSVHSIDVHLQTVATFNPCRNRRERDEEKRNVKPASFRKPVAEDYMPKYEPLQTELIPNGCTYFPEEPHFKEAFI